MPKLHPVQRLAGRATSCALLTLLALAGCGGGGGDEPAPTETPSSGRQATCGLPGFQAELLEAVNAVRQSGASCGTRGAMPPVAALAWHPLLAQAALGHGQDMVSRNFFSHTGSNSSDVGDRVAAAGYAATRAGENLGAGQRSVASVMAAWLASEGHCANLMNAAYRELGVACVQGGTANPYPTYWTMVLATPR